MPEGAHRRVVAALCRDLGGQKVYVPAKDHDDAARRVAAALAAGATIAEAARVAGISERHARRLRRAARRGHSRP